MSAPSSLNPLCVMCSVLSHLAAIGVHVVPKPSAARFHEGSEDPNVLIAQLVSPSSVFLACRVTPLPRHAFRATAAHPQTLSQRCTSATSPKSGQRSGSLADSRLPSTKAELWRGPHLTADELKTWVPSR